MDALDQMAWKALHAAVRDTVGHFHPLNYAAARAADGHDPAAQEFWREFLNLTPEKAQAIERTFKERTDGAIESIRSAIASG